MYWTHGNDYVLIRNKAIEHRIKGIVGWHEYDFDLLAFLIKTLYE